MTRSIDYTALVGKNESGKTSTLKALHKFNPAQPMPYVGLREFPRKRFHEFRGDEPVAALTFKLSQEERDSLKTIDKQYDKVEKVKITKDYSGKYAFEFVPNGYPVLTISSISHQISELKKALTSIEFLYFKVNSLPRYYYKVQSRLSKMESKELDKSECA